MTKHILTDQLPGREGLADYETALIALSRPGCGTARQEHVRRRAVHAGRPPRRSLRIWGFNPSLDSTEDQVARIKQLEGDILTAARDHMMFNYILSVLF